MCAHPSKPECAMKKQCPEFQIFVTYLNANDPTTQVIATNKTPARFQLVHTAHEPPYGSLLL